MNFVASLRASSVRAVRPPFALVATAFCLAQAAAVAAPISFGGSYSQNFDALASTGTGLAWAQGSTLPGWYLYSAAGTDVATYRAGTGSDNAGSFYSFGAAGASERALGGVASGSLSGWMALAATNDTGSTIDNLNIAFTGEQWRNGGNTSAQPMVLEYGFGSSFAGVASWQPASDLTWSSPVVGSTASALDGNAAANRVARQGLLTGLGWQPGQTLWLRWVEANDAGNDHGLAIDDFQMSATAAALTFTAEAGATAGSSDASTAFALDDDWMVVGDDEASVLRVYPRTGGQAVKAWSYDAALGLAGAELDLEASTRIGSTVYLIGSHSNKKGGNEADSREHLFAVSVSGTGASTNFVYQGKYAGLEAALANWDSSNAHGKGADYFGLAASSAGGVVPESRNGFSIEGLAALPSGALLLGFRAPQVSANTRTKALMVPLTNADALLSGAASAPAFGAPIELDLGGRGIRSIEQTGNGQFLIVAGPAGPSTPTATSSNFVFYVWDGTSASATRLDNQLDALLAGTGGSFETIVSPASTAPGTAIQLLQDNGDTIWPGQTAVSKDLAPADQRFMGNWVKLGNPVAVDSVAPSLQSSAPANNATGVSIGVQPSLTFSEPVRPGEGAFVIRSGGAVVATLSASDGSQVLFAGNTVTLKPGSLLQAGTAYVVEVQGSPVQDEAGNAWVPGALGFTTGAPPAVESYGVLISEVNSNAGGGDFFELYNHGSTALDLSGWRWTDNSEGFALGKVFPSGTVLQPGKSLVVVAEGAPAAFCAAWGMADCTNVIEVLGKGLGKGDAVFVYDTFGQIVASMVYGLTPVQGKSPVLNTAGTAPQVSAHAGPAVAPAGVTVSDNVSAVWDGASTSAPRYTSATVGTQGAFAQPASPASIGSPGTSGVQPPAAAVTLISAIQGTGERSPLEGQTVTIRAVITAHMPDLSGFFVQEEAADSDGNPNTSEGIFVYYGSTNPGVSAGSVGQLVELTGRVSEYNGNTQIGNVTNLQLKGAAVLPEPVTLTLPIADMAIWERHEGMRVRVVAASGGPLVVSDSYALGRYGSVTLAPDRPLVQFTETSAPSVSGFAAYAQQIRRSQIVLDDGSSRQNPATVPGRNGQPLSAGNTLRAGDGTASVVGVLDQFLQSGDPAYATSYRVQPTETALFTGAARPTAETLQAAVGAASAKIASVNVLNYFNLTSGSFTTPLGNSMEVRGAENADELQRQQAKLVATLIGLNADVYGLMEIQNNGFGASSALKTLTDALNASPAKPAGAVYDYVKAPFRQGSGTAPGAGSDAITVAMIYRSDRVTPQGQAAVADPAVYSSFDGAVGGSRVPLLQTFAVNGAGSAARFSVVANHFKSKGSVLAGAGNADQLDGQGNNAAARVLAAEHLKQWLDTQPTGEATPNLVLLGDFNSYAKEAPIARLESFGFQRMSRGYSYSFDGLWGSLDHIFVSPSLVSRVSGVVEWAINAEEPTVLDYNTNFKSVAQQSAYYADTAYRSSDHNPIVLGLNFSSLPPSIAGVPATAQPVTVGQLADLADFTVSDVDSSSLSVTLLPTNGVLAGVTDQDPALNGVQLSGTPAALNAQLAQVQFRALAAGSASLVIAVSDGDNPAVTATYPITATAGVTTAPVREFAFTPAGQGEVAGRIGEGGATCELDGNPRAITWAEAGAPGVPVAGATMPYGLLNLKTTRCDTGGVVNVTLTYPQPLPADTEYWKWGPTADERDPHWYRVPAVVSGNTIRFSLEDGGLGDDDLTANGQISDPGGPVLRAAAPGTPGGAVMPVPGLSEWAMSLLAMAMGGVLALFKGRRKA